MLALKPNCELCDKDLPPSATDTMICTYECTFCASCVENTLFNVCPNCGGGFERRPIRPKIARRHGVGLAHQEASTKRILTKFTAEEISVFAQTVRDILPRNR